MTDYADVMPRGMYRDPLDVLISAENKTCRGCAHVGIAFNSAYCEKGRPYGRRCNLFSEGEHGER